MDKNYAKYLNLIKIILSDERNDKFLLNFPLNKYFGSETISNIDNSSDKVKAFFDVFINVNGDEKFKDLIKSTSDITQSLKLLLDDFNEAKIARKNMDLIIQVLKSKNSHLEIEDKTAFEKEFFELQTYLHKNNGFDGNFNFLMSINLFDGNCYNELLSNCYLIKLNESILSGEYDDNNCNMDIDQCIDYNEVFAATVVRVESCQKLELHDFQIDLAKHAIEGHNVMVCAPTGSGKTLVAIQIVQEHLKLKNCKKVAFLVNANIILRQQFNQFRSYLSDSKIISLCGLSPSRRTCFTKCLDRYDILILSSDILKNALEDNANILSSFSLLVFDECHHCDKKHSYNMIMNYYFEQKFLNQDIPQIIGLTASTGTGKASNQTQALNKITTLCANMDIHKISTIDENWDWDYFHKGIEILQIPKRKSDVFGKEIQNQMKACEELLMEMKKNNYFPSDKKTLKMLEIPTNRLHQNYCDFVENIDKRLYAEVIDKNQGRQIVFLLYKFLSVLYQSLLINALFRRSDVIDYIHAKLSWPREVCLKTDECGKRRNVLIENLKKLDDFIDADGTENPSLDTLVKIIQSQFAANNKSRVILFVTKRRDTIILKNVLLFHVSSIKCETVIGKTNISVWIEILRKFKIGEIDVLIATKVAEEGLDIPDCNLVIKYAYVTDEIGLVQSRGRGRSPDARYVVIVPHEMNWQAAKEKFNEYRESLMYKALIEFQNNEGGSIDEKVNKQLNSREIIRQKWKENVKCPPKKRAKITSDKLQLKCRECEYFICDTSDIKKINDYYCITNQKCTKKCFEIRCQNCQSILGKPQKFPHQTYHIMDIKNIAFYDGVTVVPIFDWKDVPCEIAQWSSCEFPK